MEKQRKQKKETKPQLTVEEALKLLQWERIKAVKNLIKCFALNQKGLRVIDPSRHNKCRGAITALLNKYAELRGKEPHAVIKDNYKYEHGYRLMNNFIKRIFAMY